MNEKLRVLVVDDEAAIRSVLKRSLLAEGYEVAEAETGTEGLKRTAEFHPHLVILDLGLPDMGGLHVLQNLRTWTAIPILVLTVNDHEETKVELLDAGANDYLTKPFGSAELLARVRVAIRQNGQVEATPLFVSGQLEVDLNKKTVLVAGAPTKLSATEYQLLACLVRDHGRVVPQVQLLRQIWGEKGEDQGHYLRIYINQLRKKIEPTPSQPTHILTEPGIGYRLV